ncbi:hypothetical protein [Streptomyces sp. NPDC014777]|uniref:TRADD-N-associated membrane domain-containing protein n=1 Tax=Streptomyces sp. NPDC014777 TaxID=3364910 RepID=UPI0036FA3D15
MLLPENGDVDSRFLLGSAAALGVTVPMYYLTRRADRAIEVGRERVREAERDVEGALAARPAATEFDALAESRRLALLQQLTETEAADPREIAQLLAAQSQREIAQLMAAQSEMRRDRDLTLARLWKLTHTRLELYHEIATTQARRSFFTAQFSMVIGFGLLVLFVVLALKVSNTAGAIAAGGLGAVSAALAGFISKTFVKSQQTAAEHLKAYFDQPLEFSRYLAAERLLADAGLPDEQRAAVVAQLVQMIAAGPGAGEPVDAKGLLEQLQEMMPGQGS